MKYIPLSRFFILLLIITSCDDSLQNFGGFPSAGHIQPQIEGFEVQQILKGEGEFLSICTDPQGRLLISPRRGNLHRVDVINNGKGTINIDTLDVGVEDCQGLLYAYGNLYMMGSGPNDTRGVFRLKDLNGMGDFGDPILMKEFSRNGDHSGHTLTLGPDGMIYFLTGNSNPAPKGDNISFVNNRWYQDRLAPIESAYGTNQLPPGGYVMRTDSLGEHWEFFAYGLRNPYDMCFSPEGELFTFDSDNEWDVNMPWYRPIRVNHLVSGGDYAWRQSTAKRFDYYPDVWPSIVDLKRGSPTATCFGTGSIFPAPYQQSLLLGDWSYGKIYALHLTPEGASYSGEYETLISGQPLNITDMIVGKDGAIYFTTGGNGTDTGLFRIIYNGDNTPKHSMPEDQSQELRTLRKELEGWHFSDDPEGLAIAIKHMGHPDRFIRNAARVILERHDPQLWSSSLENDLEFDAHIQLLLALIRTDEDNEYQDIIDTHLSTFNLTQLKEQELLAIIRLYELSFTRNPHVDKSSIQSAYDQLIQIYPSDYDTVNKEASHVLGYICSKRIDNQYFISTTLELIETTKNTALFIHYLGTLRNIDQGWKNDQIAAYQYWLDYAQENLSGGSLFSHYLGAYEKEFKQSMGNKRTLALRNQTPAPLDPQNQGPVPPRPKTYASTFAASQGIIQDWQIQDLNTSLELVTSPRLYVERDFNRGKQMFKKGLCLSCHYMHDQGGNIGPDLTTAGNSFGVEELLTAIVEPSKDISSRFQSTQFTLKDGQIIHGRVISENDENLVVQIGGDINQTQEIFKNDISSQETSQISAMPKGLLNTMNKEEVLDLLYYISEVARKSKSGLTAEIHEDQTIFEQGDSTLVEIIDYSGQGDIFYTLDGTEPTEKSMKYEKPFFLRESSLIKAVSIYEEIQSDVQVRSVHAVNKETNGLKWSLYRNRDPELPENIDTEPDDTGIGYRINVNNIAEAENKFLLHFDGYIQVNEPGTYQFYSLQDDFIRLYIDDQLVLESLRRWFDGEQNGEIDLTKGRHKISVEYYDHLSTEYIEVLWEGPGIPKQEIPGHVLFQTQN